MNKTYRIGEATVTRIDEIILNGTDPAVLYPELDAAALAEHGSSLTPGSYNPQTGHFTQSIHSWLVRLPGHVILIDTATGNGKHLPSAPRLDNLNEPYLERLKAAGVQPGQVDLVLLTHLHADHVGWNTQRQGENWIPAFPNARHVFSRIEQRYNAALSGFESAPDLPPAALGAPMRLPTPGVYRESVVPVVEAGLAQLIEVDGSEIVEGISFHPTPGHSIDHASIRLRSGGEEAWFLGDVMHHPLQVYRTDLRSVYCEFSSPARASRRWALEAAAESDATCFTTHFAETSAGKVLRRKGGFGWQFV
jgi:glyoxylase-like metal-dependent hydrolase (beta-lactamase superfamily II)